MVKTPFIQPSSPSMRALHNPHIPPLVRSFDKEIGVEQAQGCPLLKESQERASWKMRKRAGVFPRGSKSPIFESFGSLLMVGGSREPKYWRLGPSALVSGHEPCYRFCGHQRTWTHIILPHEIQTTTLAHLVRLVRVAQL